MGSREYDPSVISFLEPIRLIEEHMSRWVIADMLCIDRSGLNNCPRLSRSRGLGISVPVLDIDKPVVIFLVQHTTEALGLALGFRLQSVDPRRSVVMLAI